MGEDAKDIPEKLEKYGIFGGIGMLLIIIALVFAKPITSLSEIKDLSPKEFIIFICCLIGILLIAYDLLRTNRRRKNANTVKLLKDNFDFPEKIESAIVSQLYSRYFFKEEVIFCITVESISSENVLMTTELSYFVTNRTNEKHHWQMEYTFKNAKGKLIEAKFDNLRFMNSPDTQFGRGVRIPQLMAAKQKSKVYFKVSEKFRLIDYELYTSYNPATDLTLIIDNKFEELNFDFEIFYVDTVIPKKIGNQTILAFNNGILPHQGVRLNWEKK